MRSNSCRSRKAKGAGGEVTSATSIPNLQYAAALPTKFYQLPTIFAPLNFVEQNEPTIRKNLQNAIDLKQQLLSDEGTVNLITEMTEAIVQAYRNGHKVFFCGNGGSAADAQHLAAELSGRYYYDLDRDVYFRQFTKRGESRCAGQRKRNGNHRFYRSGRWCVEGYLRPRTPCALH